MQTDVEPAGPTFPGAQVYPPQCLRNMLACGFRYDPSTGTWNAPSGPGRLCQDVVRPTAYSATASLFAGTFGHIGSYPVLYAQ